MKHPINLHEKPLETTEDLAGFAASYKRAGGCSLALDSDLLERGDVRGFYQSDRLVGGYIVKNELPFQAFGDMKDADIGAVLDSGSRKPPYELTCVWMVPESRRTVTGTAMWLLVVRAILARPRQRVVISARSKSLRDFYLDMGFTLRYTGEQETTAGAPSVKYILTLDSISAFARASVRVSSTRMASGARKPARKLLRGSSFGVVSNLLAA